jgi:hypothetical protein
MEFIKQVLLFQSKEKFNWLLGVFCWLNILNGTLALISLIHQL